MATTPLQLDRITRPRQAEECHGMALVAHIEAMLAEAPANDSALQTER